MGGILSLQCLNMFSNNELGDFLPYRSIGIWVADPSTSTGILGTTPRGNKGNGMSEKNFGDYANIYIGGEDSSSPVMTSTEAADYLKMHVKTVCRLAKEGKIPAKKVGSEWRFLKSVLDRWLTKELV